MLEGYSLNKDLASNEAISFDNVTIKKGCSAVFASPSIIELNKYGIYMISVDGSVTSTEAADAAVQLYKAGVAQPQGQASASITAGATRSLSFSTLVQVTPCCCSSPTVVQIINTGDAVTYDNVNIVVTKIC